MKEYPTLAEVLKRHGLDPEKIIVRDGEVSADLMHQFLNINFRCIVMPENFFQTAKESYDGE